QQFGNLVAPGDQVGHRGRHVVQRPPPERGPAKDVGQGGPYLASPDHSGDDAAEVTTDPLAFPYQVAPQDLEVLALLVEALPPRVQRVHGVEAREHEDLAGDLAQGRLRRPGQERLGAEEAGVADRDATYPDREATVLRREDDALVPRQEAHRFEAALVDP